jgi:hypothetical protein
MTAKAMGRPSKYRPEFVEQAKKLCSLGATDIELADFFGIHIATLHRWKNENEAFCDALKVSKEIADNRVERSLYERASGYERDEIDIRVIDHQIVKTPIRKYYPPDTTACIFWLKNRRPDLWRDKREEPAPSEGNSDDLLKAIAEKLPD